MIEVADRIAAKDSEFKDFLLDVLKVGAPVFGRSDDFGSVNLRCKCERHKNTTIEKVNVLATVECDCGQVFYRQKSTNVQKRTDLP